MDLLKPLARSFSSGLSTAEDIEPPRKKPTVTAAPLQLPTADELAAIFGKRIEATAEDRFAEARHVPNGAQLQLFSSFTKQCLH